MQKKISISLIALSLLIGSQAKASLEDTLANIDFKGLCKGENGSDEIGSDVNSKADQLLTDIIQKLYYLKSETRKAAQKGNAAAEALVKELDASHKNFTDIKDKLGDNWSRGCF